MNRLLFYIKNGKGIGILFLLASAVLSTMFIMVSVRSIYTEFKPEIVLVANEFLPITVKDGEIIQPVNAYKKLELDLGNDQNEKNLFPIVLDTRENIEAPAIGKQGLFITKDTVYLASPEQIKKFKLVDGELTEDNLPQTLDNVVGYVSTWISLLFIVMWGVAYLIKTGIVVLLMRAALYLLKKQNVINLLPLMRLSSLSVAVVEFVTLIMGRFFYLNLSWVIVLIGEAIIVLACVLKYFSDDQKS